MNDIDFLEADNLYEKEDEVIKKTGLSNANLVANSNYFVIKEYVRMVADPSFFGWGGLGTLEFDEIRVRRHNTIAIAFNLPRKLVSLCRDDIFDKQDNKSTDIFSYFYKTKDLEETVKLFVSRLVKARYEFYIEGKHNEMVEKVTDTVWLEKAADEINSIQGLPSLTA